MSEAELDSPDIRTVLPDRPAFPYPGLRPFEMDEWSVFFGRESTVDAIVEHLYEKRMVNVHGRSGEGKSSVVRAGVLPRMVQSHARAGLQFRICIARPGRNPLKNLVAELAKVEPSVAPLDFYSALILGEGAPDAVAKLLGLGPRNCLCLLIDQFEELFRATPGSPTDEASLVARFLTSFQKAPPENFYLILTMRSDYVGDCARFDGLAETVNSVQYLLPRMNFPNMIRAVVEPAWVFNQSVVSEDLAVMLVAEAMRGADELPLVQHALAQLWRAKTRGKPASERVRLDATDFQEHKSLTDFLSEHADEVYNEAAPDPESQRIVAEAFRALSDMTAEGAIIRRRQDFAALADICRASPETLEAALSPFRAKANAFLTPYLPAAVDSYPLDIGHEALIRNWHRLSGGNGQKGWLQREQEDGTTWRVLRAQAARLEKDGQSFLSETAVAEAEQWLATRSPQWTKRYGGGFEQVEALLKKSRQRNDVEKENKKLIETQAKRAKRNARLYFLIPVVSLASLALFCWFWLENFVGERQRGLENILVSVGAEATGKLIASELKALESLRIMYPLYKRMGHKTNDELVRIAHRYAYSHPAYTIDGVAFGLQPGTHSMLAARRGDEKGSRFAAQIIARDFVSSETNGLEATDGLGEIIGIQKNGPPIVASGFGDHTYALTSMPMPDQFSDFLQSGPYLNLFSWNDARAYPKKKVPIAPPQDLHKGPLPLLPFPILNPDGLLLLLPKFPGLNDTTRVGFIPKADLLSEHPTGAHDWHSFGIAPEAARFPVTSATGSQFAILAWNHELGRNKLNHFSICLIDASSGTNTELRFVRHLSAAGNAGWEFASQNSDGAQPVCFLDAAATVDQATTEATDSEAKIRAPADLPGPKQRDELQDFAMLGVGDSYLLVRANAKQFIVLDKDPTAAGGYRSRIIAIPARYQTPPLKPTQRGGFPLLASARARDGGLRIAWLTGGGGAALLKESVQHPGDPDRYRLYSEDITYAQSLSFTAEARYLVAADPSSQEKAVVFDIASLEQADSDSASDLKALRKSVCDRINARAAVAGDPDYGCDDID